ncbi:deleted in malignant brain tumors 1 protein-like [Haliotis rubra]|uniref:deleted in malignant brain tumors 1 protein-like n=1 Tax=Haliotis rubra TaxID=36100 RepID=UPI001EE5EFC6|nr:deleted in malignant brain tumors 1 protein-like [Haliotis rubra]
MEGLWVLCLVATWLNTVTGQQVITVQNIRLAGGPNANSGRVEVLIDGTWGTVCDDQWDDLDAAVVCKMLNYRNGGQAFPLARYGQGVGPIHLDDVQCDGDEERIDRCRMTTISNCLHSEDASVICDPSGPVVASPTPATTDQPRTVGPVPDNCVPGSATTRRVRLVAADNLPGRGMVEVFNGTYWGSVCDDFFDENAAKIVCGTLCFNTTYARAGAPPEAIGPPRSEIVLDDVRCVGNEAQIQNCANNGWGNHNCAPTEIASVTCVNLRFRPPADPVPVLDCRDGYLIAAFSSILDPNLEEKHLTILNSTCVPLRSHDNSTVVIRIPFAGCGTNVTYNATHIFYNNVIKYDYTVLEGQISRVNTFLVRVTCQMPREAAVTRPLDPQTQVVTQKSTGQFIVTMSFYRNNTFSNPDPQVPLRLPLGEWINVGLQLENVHDRLKLIVPDCVATPNNDINNPIRYPLFRNSCRDEPTLAFFNLNQTRFGYRYQPFAFVGYEEVFLHCGAFVCVLDDLSAECDRSCNNAKGNTTTGRRKRDAMPREKIYIHSGPMIVYKLENSMTVLERIGEPQTVSRTFTFPMSTSPPPPSPTSTPSPHVQGRVGTSVKVIHHETTTMKIDDFGGSGDVPDQASKSTKVLEDVTTTTKATTTADATTTPAAETTRRNIDTTTKEYVTTKDYETTSRLNDATTLRQDGAETKTERQTSTETTPSMVDASNGVGFLVERGVNSDNPQTAQQQANALQGYVPSFISASVRSDVSLISIFLCLSASIALRVCS